MSVVTLIALFSLVQVDTTTIVFDLCKGMRPSGIPAHAKLPVARIGRGRLETPTAMRCCARGRGSTPTASHGGSSSWCRPLDDDRRVRLERPLGGREDDIAVDREQLVTE